MTVDEFVETKVRGSAKHARHVRMKNLGDVNAPALEYYIRQAMKLDEV